MNAYIKAKASKDEQVLLEVEQWELNSWPKVALKLPAAGQGRDLEELVERAEIINVNCSLLYRDLKVI